MWIKYTHTSTQINICEIPQVRIMNENLQSSDQSQRSFFFFFFYNGLQEGGVGLSASSLFL